MRTHLLCLVAAAVPVSLLAQGPPTPPVERMYTVQVHPDNFRGIRFRESLAMLPQCEFTHLPKYALVTTSLCRDSVSEEGKVVIFNLLPSERPEIEPSWVFFHDGVVVRLEVNFEPVDETKYENGLTAKYGQPVSAKDQLIVNGIGQKVTDHITTWQTPTMTALLLPNGRKHKLGFVTVMTNEEAARLAEAERRSEHSLEGVF